MYLVSGEHAPMSGDNSYNGVSHNWIGHNFSHMRITMTADYDKIQKQYVSNK